MSLVVLVLYHCLMWLRRVGVQVCGVVTACDVVGGEQFCVHFLRQTRLISNHLSSKLIIIRSLNSIITNIHHTLAFCSFIDQFFWLGISIDSFILTRMI